jgi:hypothetical protein
MPNVQNLELEASTHAAVAPTQIKDFTTASSLLQTKDSRAVGLSDSSMKNKVGQGGSGNIPSPVGL